MKISKSVSDDIRYRTLTFSLLKKTCVLSTGWALNKNDWWYEDNPADTKFFDLRKSDGENHIRYGVYVARFCLVLMKEK